jgi:hypothetical protein
VPATLEQITDALEDRGIVVGRTQVVAVRTRLDSDPITGDAIIIKLILADPSEGLDTWPAEDLWSIRELTRDLINEADPDGTIPWVVSFEPESAGELDTDDTAEEVQIDL